MLTTLNGDHTLLLIPSNEFNGSKFNLDLKLISPKKNTSLYLFKKLNLISFMNKILNN